MAPVLSVTRRLRNTPFTSKVTTAGATSYTVYNRMLLPTSFVSVEDDYHHLKNHVQIWDVACERQVEVKGVDAAALMQRLTPRNLANMNIGQCYYIPVVDQSGGMLNDPVALKLADNHFWISLADSDLLLWIKGLVIGGGYDVEVLEPDISPLAVQGPKSEFLMSRVFGNTVLDINFFRFKRLDFQGREMIVARSGYSKQGGFEIYLNGSDMGEILWDTLFDAGHDLEVRAGCPNLIERIESGLLSYGNDMTSENTPYECGLGNFCHLDLVPDCIGADALRREATEGPTKQIRSLSIQGDPQPPCTGKWPVFQGDQYVGDVTSAAWSPNFDTIVALGMVNAGYWDDGTQLEVQTPHGMRIATVHERSFTERSRLIQT